MDNLTLLGLAVALGMDAFAVALAVSSGLCFITFRHIFRLTWHFGLFQSLMTLVGWLGGASVSGLFGGLNNWMAFGLLVFIGLKMVKESGDTEKRLEGFDPTRGWSLVGLSVATSLDALAVGISFSLIGTKILFPVSGNRTSSAADDPGWYENRSSCGKEPWTVGRKGWRGRTDLNRSQNSCWKRNLSH